MGDRSLDGIGAIDRSLDGIWLRAGKARPYDGYAIRWWLDCCQTCRNASAI
jgi:hypothetical protein